VSAQFTERAPGFIGTAGVPPSAASARKMYARINPAPFLYSSISDISDY
jgi:hypothetical protein